VIRSRIALIVTAAVAALGLIGVLATPTADKVPVASYGATSSSSPVLHAQLTAGPAPIYPTPPASGMTYGGSQLRVKHACLQFVATSTEGAYPMAYTATQHYIILPSAGNLIGNPGIYHVAYFNQGKYGMSIIAASAQSCHPQPTPWQPGSTFPIDGYAI
jgi:hypothetical protein